MERSAGQLPTPLGAPVPIRSEPSFESRLGSQYLNRAGILALLVGVSYFLHLAFTNNWVGSTLRVIIGLIGGAAVIGVGQAFQRRGYLAFALSLKGLGIGILYLSVWAGFQLYHLASLPLAAGAMIAITAATVIMALLRQSEGLATLAFAGGFATPILLYTGSDLYRVLFAYLLLLSAGMLLLVKAHGWKNLLLVSFVGCFCVSFAWFWTFFRADVRIVFATYSSALLAIYTFAAVAALRQNPSSTVARVVALGASVAYLFAVRNALHGDACVLLIVVGAVFILVGWRRQTMLRASSFSLGVAYSAAAIPIGLDSHWTTSAIWLALGTLLLIFGFVKNLAFVRWDALVLIAITFLKVFISDLTRLEQGYRVLAASILGVTLLAISFSYQRYRVKQG